MTLKKLVLCLIAALCAFITLALMVLPICTITVEYDTNVVYYISESTYSFLGFNSWLCSPRSYLWAKIMIGVFAYFQLIVAVSTLLTSIFLMLWASEKTVSKYLFGQLSSLLVFNLLLTIAGIVTAALSADWAEDGVMTYTWISFLLVLVGFILFIYYNVKLPAECKVELTKAPQEDPAPAQHLSESDSLDMLVKYKEMLDSGVITQEEFDAKKKQLLM